MEWSNENCLLLLEEYKKHPVLWDTRHGCHFHKVKREVAWDVIAQRLQVDAPAIRQKMNSLLGSFRRERCKGRKFVKTARGTHNVYESRWFAFDKMRFLLYKPNRQGPFVHESENSANSEQNNQTEVAARVEPTPKEKPTPADTTRKKTTIENRVDDERLPTEDCSFFGQYVAKKLQTYPAKVRAFVEHSISTCLFEADMGKYDYLLGSSSQVQDVGEEAATLSSDVDNLKSSPFSRPSSPGSNNSAAATSPTEHKIDVEYSLQY